MLLLDEPVSAQDSKTVKEISQSLSELVDAEGAPVTVLAVTHSTDLLDSFTHAIFMLNGRVVECDTKERLLARKGHFYRRMVSTSGLYIDAKGNAVITAERLRQVWLFSTGPILSLQATTKLFVTRFLAAGDRVLKAGEDADAMFVVVQGTIELLIEEAGGARTSKQIYQAGDDFGVLGLIDNTLKWPGTAHVVSPRAMVLVLYQVDIEELLQSDLGLAESFGELVTEISRLRSPGRLATMWPFFGASQDALERVSEALEPETYDESTLLCDAPNDPCSDLHVLVMGRVSAVRADGTVDKIGRGATFGEGSILPLAAAGSVEELIRGEQNDVTTARADEFTVILQLPREKYAGLMEREPGLLSAYKDNIARWVDAIKPSALMQHWLFSCCGPQAIALLSPRWVPSVVQEGSNLVALGSSDCVLVLVGCLQVRIYPKLR